MRRALLTLLLLAAGLTAWPQPPTSSADPVVEIQPRLPRHTQPSPIAPGIRQANIRTESSLVLVPVEVFTKRQNQPIIGLDQEHFRLFEEGVEQKILNFTGEDAPVSIGIVVDYSGSMSNSIVLARAGVVEFLKTTNPEDQFFLVNFSSRPELTMGFTNNPSDIQNAGLLTPVKGRTALLDAVYLALNQMRKAKHRRQALLVLSDGADNSSRYTLTEVRNALRETNVQIYTIGISTYDNGPAVLKGLSEESGGVYFPDVNARELVDVCAKIGIQLRHQYVLAYQPSNREHDGKWRRVQVKLVPPRGLPPLATHHRLGYYAPEQ